MKSYDLFVLLYGICFGVGYGLAWMAPVISVWSYFPNNKGLVGGFIAAAFGLGSAVFNEVATFIINPGNHPPDLEVITGKVVDYYYDFETAQYVPNMLRTLAAIWFTLMFIGTIMV